MLLFATEGNIMIMRVLRAVDGSLQILTQYATCSGLARRTKCHVNFKLEAAPSITYFSSKKNVGCAPALVPRPHSAPLK
jgi:hypothetical protein